MTRGSRMILYTAAILLIIVLLFYGLVQARSFLKPFSIAVILSLMVLPLANKMEHSMSRGLAAFLNSFMLFLVSLGIVALISMQIQNLVQDWPQIKKTMQPKIEQAKQFLIKNSPLDEGDFQASKKGSDETILPVVGSGGKNVQASGMLSSILGFFGNYLLTFIYIFFLLLYRRRFKVFMIRIFPDEKADKVRDTIEKSARVAPKYLRGKLILMAIIAVLYGVGLGITGINNFILVTLISTLLILIPYVGNIIAYLLAISFGFLTSGDTTVIIGVTITFAVAQFIESYILEPYLLGDEVDVHPFFVILAVIIGGLVWGVTGMILAIPLIGILTVVLLNIKELHPLGLLFSREKLE